MADRVCTNFIDSDGLDLGCHLVSKEYMLEAYPELAPWMKAPGLWVWGRNSCGALGDNSLVNESSPVQTISAGTNWKQVDAAAFHSGAIKTDGTLWLWGSGFSGRLGNNAIVNASSPVQTISGGTNWKQLSIYGDSSAAIKTDGTLWLWGRGDYLPNNLSGTANNRSSPVQTISGGTNWKQVSLGYFHGTSIKTDGTLWTWGSASGGRLGNNCNTINMSSPVQTISGGTDWKQVSAGREHTAAIKTNGTLWLWGGNTGNLGDNTTINRSSPVQTVSGGTNWKQVKISSAIKTDGTLCIWGGARISSPVQTISGGTNWRETASYAAIKTDGTLWFHRTNSNGNGGVGNNSTIAISSPVQTVSGGTGWRQVVTSAATLAIRDEEEY